MNVMNLIWVSDLDTNDKDGYGCHDYRFDTNVEKDGYECY